MFKDNQYLTQKLAALLSVEFKVDISKETRARPHVDGRKVYARILRDKGWSLSKIARPMGKHHSTIIHYLKDVEWLIEHDPEIRDIYFRVSKLFDHHLEFDPIHSKTRGQLLQMVYGLEDEKKLLISAIKTLDEQLQRKEKFKALFQMVSDRLPDDKLDEFSTKVNRILNGI